MLLQSKLTAYSTSLLLLAPWMLPGACASQAACGGISAACQPSSVIAQPSLGEIARQQRAERSQSKTGKAPLYTNDNLPTSDEGLSVLGPSTLKSGEEQAGAPAAQSASEAKEIVYLRRELSRAREHLNLHQRELAVLQQQISQSKMQWYPNPNQTLMQEYSRGNISSLAGKIQEKHQQISEDQREIQALNDQLQRDQARFGWVKSVAQAGGAASPTAAAPGLKRGTPEYWQSRIQSARQQLAMAEEQLGVTKKELSLLRLQQLRVLDPNIQADLASRVSAKQEQLNSAQAAVESARQQITRLEQEARNAAGHGPAAGSSGAP